MKALFSKTTDPKIDKYVAEFLKLSNFLVTGNYLKRIKVLCLTLEPNQRSFVYLSSKIDPPVTTAIEKLKSAIVLIHIVTDEELGLADLLSSEVASRLVLILNSIDLFDIKCMAAKILSRLNFNKCRDAINEAVPVLLEAICNDMGQVAVAAASTLARLAFASSKWVNVSHFQDVQNALTKHRKREAEIYLTMYLVFVCRGNDLTLSDKVKVVLPILEHMLIEWDICLEISLVRVCYALSYLTFATHVELKQPTCKRLMECTSHKLSSVAGSALGVIGNIVRWGSPLQIQCLVKDCKLMQILGQKVLCSSFKKFRMEGCRIISNIAAQSEIFIKDMDEAGLTHLLSNLLEADECDVKMEAAWAVFNMHYNVKYKHEYIDNYEKDIVMSNASEINLEVEQEKSGLTT